jgi:RNA polymerase sigma factor (TIGR02999 family)
MTSPADDPPASELAERLRAAFGSGDADALFAALYAELHRLAERHLRRNGELSLGTTTLVHQLYLSMAERRVEFPDRGRFFAYASRAMRGLVIDYGRRRRARKRGRDVEITLAEHGPGAPGAPGDDLVALGDALEELAALDPRLAGLVDLHFFAGFSFGEIAELRGVSERTVQRDWRKARLLLHRSLGGAAPIVPPAPNA